MFSKFTSVILKQAWFFATLNLIVHRILSVDFTFCNHFLPLLISWKFCNCQHWDFPWVLNLAFRWIGIFSLVYLAFLKFFRSLLMSKVRVTMKKCLNFSAKSTFDSQDKRSSRHRLKVGQTKSTRFYQTRKFFHNKGRFLGIICKNMIDLTKFKQRTRVSLNVDNCKTETKQ